MQHKLIAGVPAETFPAEARVALVPDALATRTHLVVPVPLARTRLLERGYNQSARLAAGIAAAHNWPLLEAALIRTRATRSQTRLSADARRANVTGAFAAHAPTVRARDVLIVDDIFDTGNTIEKLVESLKFFEPHSIRTAVLLVKEGRSEVEITPDFHCFQIPDAFVIGYGLDYKGYWRNAAGIFALKGH